MYHCMNYSVYHTGVYSIRIFPRNKIIAAQNLANEGFAKLITRSTI